MILTRAIDKKTAHEIAEKKSGVKKDTRNLYLAKEGGKVILERLTKVILPDTPAAQGVSQEDMEKRRRSRLETKQKLRNVNFFVNPLRLSIRNFPSSWDDKQLLKLFKEASGSPKSVIKAKFLRERSEDRKNRMGSSKGIGFVEFTERSNALAALRHVNNNPDILGAKRRPIVEFTIEDARKIHKHQLRLEGMQKKLREKKKEEAALEGKSLDELEEDETEKKLSRKERLRERQKARLERIKERTERRESKKKRGPKAESNGIKEGEEVKHKGAKKEEIKQKESKKSPARVIDDEITALEKLAQLPADNVTTKRHKRKSADKKEEEDEEKHFSKFMEQSYGIPTKKKQKWYS